MATYRQIHTKIWSSPDFQQLSPHAKLVFIYLFSNSHRNEAALYRITPKTISNETDLTVAEVDNAMAELEGAGLVKYDRDAYIVWVVNAVKYQKLSPNELKAIDRNLQEIFHPFTEDFRRYYEGTLKDLGSTSKGTSVKGKGKGKRTSTNSMLQGTKNAGTKEIVLVGGGPREKRAAADPNVKIFIDYYHDRFLSRFGEKPFINGGKDGLIVKRLLSTYGLEKLKGLLDAFFDSRDPYIMRAGGYTIGMFATQINKLIQQQKAKEPALPDAAEF